MPRVVGVDIPPEKRIEISLTYIFGVGRKVSQDVLAAAQIDPNKRAKNLSDEEISRINHALQVGHKVEGDLRRDISSDVKRLIDIGAYRGVRHKRGLPVRGQQTRTNARSRKGPRMRVGGRKESMQRRSGARIAKPA